MSDWLPGYEQYIVPNASTSTWVGGYNDRVIFHTTEGLSLSGTFTTYAGSHSIPHITADLLARRKVQHLPLSASASAVMHTRYPETNRAGRAIQIEIVGFSSDSANRTESELAYLAQILVDLKLAGLNFELAALDASSPRMSDSEWISFNGVCGHRHVPENDHSDPGALDVGRVIQIAKDILLGPNTANSPSPTLPKEELPMEATYVRVKTSPTVYLASFGMSPRPVSTFKAAEFVAEQLGLKIVVAVPAKDSSDSTGEIRKVWEIEPEDAGLFGLPVLS